MQLPDGRLWSFSDPCLTTWEARELGSWLDGVRSGDVQPTDLDTEGEPRLLVFTEPNVAFYLVSRVGEAVTIRVYFALESRPPWLREDECLLLEYFVEVDMVHGEVAAAASSWERELSAFPVR